MKPEDAERFGIAMGIMGEAFQKTPSDSLAEIYFKLLQDLSIESFEQACLTLINTRKITGTFPLVAEIREAVAGAGQSLETRAALAWDVALKAMHDHGSYQSPSFADPIISRIIIAWGGWIEFGNWQAEETKWKRKEFIELYRAYSAQPGQPAPPDHLIGIAEGHNRDHFPEFVPEPVQIGADERKQKRLNG
jgi:hypothetical protein